MVKYVKIILSLSPLLLLNVASSCSKHKTYADYLKEERQKISGYIDRNQIEVRNTKPETTLNKWENEKKNDIYFRSSSGLYYHQIDSGTGTSAIGGKEALVRYKGSDLSGNLLYDCTGNNSHDPELVNLQFQGRAFGFGFQEAIRNMREGGYCKVIIPFDIGNGPNITISGLNRSDKAAYEPMVYEIWLIKVE